MIVSLVSDTGQRPPQQVVPLFTDSDQADVIRKNVQIVQENLMRFRNNFAVDFYTSCLDEMLLFFAHSQHLDKHARISCTVSGEVLSLEEILETYILHT